LGEKVIGSRNTLSNVALFHLSPYDRDPVALPDLISASVMSLATGCRREKRIVSIVRHRHGKPLQT